MRCIEKRIGASSQSSNTAETKGENHGIFLRYFAIGWEFNLSPYLIPLAMLATIDADCWINLSYVKRSVIPSTKSNCSWRLSMQKKGKLVVIGSGIKSIAHITLEAQAHLQQSDIVLYASADPVTEMWVQKQNPNYFDLYQYYGNNKNRRITYTQMIERIMEEVRQGKYVCALFYGHPGVFVTASHNAIELAHREGFEAEMLPGISAEDCLFADLGVDPSIPGLQTFEATDLLLKKRPINPEINLVIWQVGCVGDVAFKFDGFGNEKFNVLLDYLEQYYAPDHEIINYLASTSTMSKPMTAKHKLADFRKPEIAKEVSGMCTFFIPAARMTDSDPEMCKKLGLTSGKAIATPLICDDQHYPEYKKFALRNIAEHTIPDSYQFSHSSKELYELVSKLALDFKELRQFTDNPQAYLEAISGLTNHERSILGLQNNQLSQLFRRERNAEAMKFVHDCTKRPHLANQYADKQAAERKAMENGEIKSSEYETRIMKWFLNQGYATTPDAVTKAMNGQISRQ